MGTCELSCFHGPQLLFSVSQVDFKQIQTECLSRFYSCKWKHDALSIPESQNSSFFIKAKISVKSQRALVRQQSTDTLVALLFEGFKIYLPRHPLLTAAFSTLICVPWVGLCSVGEKPDVMGCTQAINIFLTQSVGLVRHSLLNK